MRPKMIIPMLVCRDPAVEIEFCKHSFDAVELSRREGQDGTIVHATLRIGEAMIMIHDESTHLNSRAPQSNGSSPVVIYLYGEEVDSVIEKAVTKGARVLLPPEDQFWGDRVGRIIDPENHVWNIACRIDEE
jgi:PhnB protein